ncbi:hypothetical protein EDI_030900 [Entamoeba dispar SAW760]|uniref:AIG1-type G domain-containing protein n=1 Tax=Entamoeba dispar (strain ATCC PRA-260 / SAW760) TaxID=370354 RepID=B0EPJ3_ENTDS|nr:uncharacterized protein EDI_030900 [Entamoeba dispar SAW760]EDR23552.1 hypothetical protein EDI_030900 [Entamoeba dispar SAW760]|eukprot:EDR23552.1 hypothetical protein EDI_030900 [Entamoeba dispar SAW760]
MQVHGKSSLGNFILKKNVFSVSVNPNSETNETKGYSGTGDRSDIFVIDTPGFNDSKGPESQREYMKQMVDYIKKEGEGLQAIVLMPFQLLAFGKSVLDEHIKTKRSDYNKELMDFINQTTGSERIIFPMFFVNSKPLAGYDNSRSENEIESLLKWARKLSFIDVDKVVKRDIFYESVILEEKDEEIIINKTKSSITIQINHLTRERRIPYYGREPVYSDWEVVSSKTKTKDFHKEYVPQYIYRDPPKEKKDKEGIDLDETIPNLLAAGAIVGTVIASVIDSRRKK